MARGPNNYILSQELPVECGVNRVIVRSMPRAGRISIEARADGLRPAVAVLVGMALQAPGNVYRNCITASQVASPLRLSK